MTHITRQRCYSCYRPQSSCVCNFISPISTKTKFVILMHPKEYRKTKNTTGHLTHKSLPNSSLFIGIDFNKHKEVQKIVNSPECDSYLLYPNEDSLNLSSEKIKTEKSIVIFIIDSTWACSRKILRENEFLRSMKSISFKHTLKSQFKIKTQPNEFCLSTIESTLCVLKLLNKQGVESLQTAAFKNFLKPFNSMVKYQLKCAKKRDLRENK